MNLSYLPIVDTITLAIYALPNTTKTTSVATTSVATTTTTTVAPVTTIPKPVHTNSTNSTGKLSGTPPALPSNTLTTVVPVGVAVIAAILVGYLVYNNATRRRRGR